MAKKKRRTVADRVREVASRPGFEHLQQILPAADRLPPEPIESDLIEPPVPFERPWGKELVAAFLGVTESGLDKLVKTGHAPPHFKAGRMPRWRPDVVRRWAAAQEASAEANANAAKAQTTNERP